MAAGQDPGSEAFSAQGATCLVGFEEVVAGVSDDGEVERRGVFSGSASVFVEGHVQGPVEALDAPISAGCGKGGLRVWSEGRDVIAGLEAFAAGLLVDAPGGDGGDGAQTSPVGVAFSEPLRLGGRAAALFDPAVAGVRIQRVRATGGQDGIGEEQRRVLMQAALIAFEREHVIRALVGDAPGDSFCVPMASIDTIAPSRLSMSKSSGIAVISLDFP